MWKKGVRRHCLVVSLVCCTLNKREKHPAQLRISAVTGTSATSNPTWGMGIVRAFGSPTPMFGSYSSEVETPVQQPSNSLHMAPALRSPCFLFFLRRVLAYGAGLQEGDICVSSW